MRINKSKAVFLLLLSICIITVSGHETEAMTFGIEYADYTWFLKGKGATLLPKKYADIGIDATKVQSVIWKDIEPSPPKKGKHNYDWEKLDKLIKILQSEGFKDIEVVLQSTSTWATRSITSDEKKRRAFGGGEDVISVPPKEEHWDDYSAFVKNIVERYDGDGDGDMPGLEHPVLAYEIETEAQGSFSWMGTVDEYKKLLQVAYKAAKAANPKTIIILSGFLLGDIPHANEKIPERINKVGRIKGGSNKLVETKDIWYEIFSFNTEILKEKDYFDIVEFHSLNDYPTIYDTVRWIRGEMKKNGYEKPIIIGDTSSVPAFFWGPVEAFPNPFSLDPLSIIEILADKNNPRFEEIYSWYRTEQSRLTVKKTAVAMELGLKKVNFGGFIDNPLSKTFLGKFFAKRFPTLFNWGIAGYLDKNFEPHPAYFTYKLTIEKLKDAKFMKRLPIRSDLYGFEFTLRGKPLYVFWSEKKDTVDVDVGSSFTAAMITHIVTERGVQEPKIEKKHIKGGKINIEVDPDPIFLEPVSDELDKAL